MNRKEFMERLEKLLWNISDGEREEALQFYNDYFDDAGPENEAQVMEELGSPEQVAKKIKAGLEDGTAEYTEQGYQDARFRENQEVAAGEAKAPGRQGVNGWKIVALILLGILAFPSVAPICFTIVMAVVAVVIGICAAMVGLAAAGIAVLLVGGVLIGVGILKLFVMAPIGIALFGAGCLVLALGILLSMLGIFCCAKAIPWVIRGIVAVLRYPFRKAGVVQ